MRWLLSFSLPFPVHSNFKLQRASDWSNFLVFKEFSLILQVLWKSFPKLTWTPWTDFWSTLLTKLQTLNWTHWMIWVSRLEILEIFYLQISSTLPTLKWITHIVFLNSKYYKFLGWISGVVPFNTWLISSLEENKWNLFHSKWSKLSFWVKIAVILSAFNNNYFLLSLR